MEEVEDEALKIDASKIDPTYERQVKPAKVANVYDSFMPTEEEEAEVARKIKEQKPYNLKQKNKSYYEELLPDVEDRPSNESLNATELRRGLRTTAQGLSAGTSDELEAGLTALFSDTPYGEARAKIMKDVSDQQAVRPGTALFQDIGGGVLGGGALVNQLIKSGRSGAVAGATEGALMGAGYGEGLEGKVAGAVGFAAFGGTIGKAVDWATTPSSKAMTSSVEGGKTQIDDALDTEVERLTERAMNEAEEAGQYQYAKAGPAGRYQQKQFSYLEEAPIEEAVTKPKEKVLRMKKKEDGTPSIMPSGKAEYELQDLTWRNAETAGEFFTGVKYLAKDFYDQKLTPASEYVMRNVAPRVGAIFQRYSETALRANTISLKTIFEPMENLIKGLDDDKMLKAMIMDYTNQTRLLAHNKEVARKLGFQNVKLDIAPEQAEQTITTLTDLQKYITANYGAEQWARFTKYLEWNKGIKQSHVKRLSGTEQYAKDAVEHVHTRKMKRRPEEEPEDIMEELAMRDDDALMGRTRLSMVDDLNNGKPLNKVDQYYNPLLTDFRRTANLEVLNQMARLFNLRRPPPDSQPTAVFDELYRTLISRGLSESKAKIAVDAMMTDFIGQSKTPNNWLQFLNSWGYAGSLAGPKSALLNLHDIPMTAVIYGPGSFKGVFKNMGYNIEDQGVVQRVGEFQNYVGEQLSLGAKDLSKQLADTSRKGTDVLMKYSGFGWTDAVGKQKITQMIIRDAVDNVDNLERRWGFYFSKSELSAIQKQIRKHGTDVGSYTGRGKDLMEELFFAGLGQQQLISSAGRPLAWARNPNMRFMWALRGFAMKQLALAHRNIIDNIAKGDNKAAWDYMKRYALFSAGAFGVINESRQWFWGDGEFTAGGILMGMGDQIVSTAFLNTIGLNDYQWGKMMQEGVTITFIKSLEPLMTSVPRNMIGDVVDSIDEADRGFQTVATEMPLIKQWSNSVKNFEEDFGVIPDPMAQFNKQFIQQEKAE